MNRPRKKDRHLPRWIKRSQIGDDGIAFKQRKTGAQLLIRWTPDLHATVDAALALSAKRPAVTLLRGKYGGPPEYRSILRQWHEACAVAGVKDAKPNDQRAMSATAAKRQGHNPQALLGHTSPSNTDRYLRDRDIPAVDGPTFGGKPSKVSDSQK